MAFTEPQLRNLYGQIIIGCTPVEIEGATAYIRHFSPLDQGELDGKHGAFLSNAIARGLETEEQKRADLDKRGLWTEKEEAELENQHSYIRGLKDSKKNLALPSQIDAQNTQIKEAEAKAATMMQSRAEVFGLTAEGYASKKLNELYIFKSLFKNKAMSEPLYSEEDFEFLDMSDLNKVALLFNEAMRGVKDSAIKRIAVAPFFQNSFGLCDDDIFKFYGKPIVSLTFHQSELAGYGRYFKHILSSEQKPPPDIAADPDKLIDWHQAAKNTSKLLNSNNAGNVAIMGATAEDMKAISASSSDPVVSLNSLTQGKSKMRGEELMRVLG